MRNLLFACRVIAEAFPLFVATLVVELLGLLAVPIALLFCNRESDHLPKWAAWWDEPVYGINGDGDWIRHHATDPQSFYWRWRWLMRNRAVGWSTKIGIPLVPAPNEPGRYTNGDGSIMYVFSMPADGRGVPVVPADQPVGREGFIGYVLMGYDGSERRGFYFIWKWPLVDRCVRAYVGWKFNELWEKGSTSYPAVPFVFTFNPITGWNK